MADFNHSQQKKGAAFEAAPSEPNKSLNANNTTASNQRAIILQALKIAPQTTITLRHNLGIMQPAPRIFELRGLGHDIHTEMVREETPDNISHKGVAKYVLRHSPPLTNNQPIDKNSEAVLWPTLSYLITP